VLDQVADSGGSAAHRRGGREAVGRAVVVRAVAALGHVADVDGGPADGGALRVGGAVGARAGAALGDVADTDGAAALRGRGLEGVGGTIVTGPVAALGDVAVAGRGTANRRALQVGRALSARAGAIVGKVADAGGAAALYGGRLQRVGGAVVAGAVAALGDVA